MPERIALLYFSILHKKKQEVFCKFTEIFLKIPQNSLLWGKLIAFFHKSGRLSALIQTRTDTRRMQKDLLFLI